uniref:Musculin n=1 Tax=Anolis carolinensis TaxID=28377 RepID=G1KQ19_ANOCA
MSTGSLSDAEEMPEMELRGMQLGFPGLPRPKRRPRGHSSAAEEEEEEEEEEEDEDEEEAVVVAGKKKRAKGAGLGGGGGGGKRQLPPLSSRGSSGGSSASAECKQSQRNAANAAFSRLKTSLPWVPPDTKLSKLDTLRLASSYIAHLRQLLQEDRYDKAGYVHPVSLTWPFMVSGRPESDAKEVSAANRLCGTTA